MVHEYFGHTYYERGRDVICNVNGPAAAEELKKEKFINGIR